MMNMCVCADDTSARIRGNVDKEEKKQHPKLKWQTHLRTLEMTLVCPCICMCVLVVLFATCRESINSIVHYVSMLNALTQCFPSVV